MNRPFLRLQPRAVVTAAAYTPITAHRLLWVAFVFLAVAIAALMLTATAYAATISVETTDAILVDDGFCSLPEAIINANDDFATYADCPNGNSADIIILATQSYTLTVATDLFDLNNGLPAITSTITISGNGATIQRIASKDPFRIFYVDVGGNLTINDVTVSGGFLYDDGGGIYNSGSLTLNRSVVEENETGDGDFGDPIGESGYSGGGIFNTGLLILNDSIIRNNRTGNGGQSIYSGSDGGSGGSGGGIFNLDALVLQASSVISNSSGSGGDGTPSVPGDDFRGVGGPGGPGGGIFNIGPLTITNSILRSNRAGAGGNGGLANSGHTGGSGGDGGWGGGIFSIGPLTITGNVLLDNSAGAGGDGGDGGDDGDGGDGGWGGDGGGIISFDSTTILRTRFIANSTGGGGQGGSAGDGEGAPGLDGEQGIGGGLAYYEFSILPPPLLLVANNLFARNNPAEGEGIALSATEETSQIIHNTFANPTPSDGIAILVLCGNASITNNIFAGFATGIENCDLGNVTSDHDLYFETITATINVTVTNQLTGDPAFFDPDNDHYRLTAKSAAIDVGTDVGVIDDFEGETRPQWFGFDVGFDELAVAAITFSKQVVGGEAAPTDWWFDIVSGTQDIPHTGEVFLPTGVYNLTEDGGPVHNANYALTGASGACSLVSGAIQLTVGSMDATCFITNTRRTATITLVKNVVNDNGGNAAPNDFALSVGGAPVTSGVSVTVLANVPVTIGEVGLPGYTFVGITGVGCPPALGEPITLDPGEALICTLINDDIAPTVTLHKLVTNDATANSNAFGLQINGTAVDSGETFTVTANTPIAIHEVGLTGYAFVAISGAGCPSALGDEVTLAVGAALVCTIANQRVGVEIRRADNDPLVEGDGGVVSYTLNLMGVPTAPVTVTLQPDTQVIVDPVTLVFTPANAATPQVVHVLAMDDTVIEGDHMSVIGHSASSFDPVYNSPGLPFHNDGATANNDQSTVLMDIVDNDTASILFRKTVSIAGYPPACAGQSTIKVPINTSIVYCFTLRNTGNTTFTVHTLIDDHLGTLLEDEEILLSPNVSVSRTFTATVAVTTTNVATWTASSIQPQDVSAAGQAPAVPFAEAQTTATVLISGPADDQDRDGLLDNEEGAGDRNGNGIPNFLDPDEPTSLDEETEPTGGGGQRIFLPLITR